MDIVEVVVIPVLLGSGVSLLEAGAPPTRLSLLHSQAYPSGLVSVQYQVPAAAAV